ncbi:MAG: glucose 1-dehydrogenase [Chlamydiales bacterium]|nr:glucose 1-dehydrogenase [Chlamydiales bacterium]
MAGRIQGKVALITGAAQGIGKACAELFAREGAFVFISDIQDAQGEALAKEIGPGACYVHLDVQSEKEWKQITGQILKQKGRLDILINNAGITGFQEGFGPQDPEMASLESWRKVEAINSEGTFLGCKYAIQAMKTKGGAIVNLSSRSGVVGIPGAAAYAASKASVRNHTKSVALYCCQKQYPIRCNSLHPAAILTPMWEEMLNKEEDREKQLARIAQDIPMRRLGAPEEVAYAALFLASDESSYITGAEITVDGGILAGSSASPKK